MRRGDTEESAMASNKRPLSPHLQVYKPQITSVLSITHRITGVGLGLGTLLIAWWLIALAAGAEGFAVAQGFMGSVIGRILLLGFTLALYFHLANGIRHLFWDAGRGFELGTVTRSGWAAVAAAVVLTALTWIAAYAMRG